MADWDVARLVAALLQPKMRYVQQEGKWYVYSDTRRIWTPEDRTGSTELVAETLVVVAPQTQSIGKYSNPSAPDIEKTRVLLRSLLAARPSDFDLDSMLFAVQDGKVVDLHKREVRSFGLMTS